VILHELLQEFRDSCSERRIVSAFFRLHPLLEFPRDALEPFGCIVGHGQTIHIDLRLPLDEILRQFRAGHRADLKKLAMAGFTATLDDWRLFSCFPALYLRTMKRVVADSRYLFPADYFQDLRSALGPHLHLCCVMTPGGELAAAGLFSERNNIVQYLFSGSDDHYFKQAPAKLMIDAVTRWARQRGNAIFHLGGGLGARADSLFLFKAGFSRQRSDFRTVRMVFDESRYDHLVALWQAHCEGLLDQRSDVFPTYRRLAHSRQPRPVGENASLQ
jgi:hypothetical protein